MAQARSSANLTIFRQTAFIVKRVGEFG